MLDGRDVSTLPPDELARVRNEMIGFVFQGFNLLARTSAVENVELPLLYTREGRGEGGGAERARRWSARRRGTRPTAPNIIPISCPAASSSGWPSHGRSSTSPSVLLADEPTGNLDTATSHEVMEIFSAPPR